MNKLSMTFKRILTGVLASAMIMTATPSYVFATEFTDETVAENTVADDSVENGEVSTNTVDSATEDTAAVDASEPVDTVEQPAEDASGENDTVVEELPVAEEAPVAEEREDSLLEEDDEDETTDVDKTDDELLGDHSIYYLMADSASHIEFTIDEITDSNIVYDKDEFLYYVVDPSKTVKVKIKAADEMWSLTNETAVTVKAGDNTDAAESYSYDPKTNIFSFKLKANIDEWYLALYATGLEQVKTDVSFSIAGISGKSWNDIFGADGVVFYDKNGYQDNTVNFAPDGESGTKMKLSGVGGGDQVSFSANPKTGKIVSVLFETVIGKDTHGRPVTQSRCVYPSEEGRFFFSAYKDSTVVINLTEGKVISFDDGFGQKYGVKASYKVGNSNKSYNLTNNDKRYVLPSDAVTFTATGINGHSVFGIFANSTGGNRLDSDAKMGSFTINSSDVDSDLSVVAETDVQIFTSASDEKFMATPTTGAKKVTEGSGAYTYTKYLTNNTGITLTVGKSTETGIEFPAGFDVKGYDYSASVRWSYSEDPEVISANGTQISIPADIVQNAQKTDTNLDIIITPTKKTVNVISSINNLATLSWYVKDEGPGSEISKDPESATEIEYNNNGKDLYVYATPDNYYTVTGVKIGSTNLAKETNTVGGKTYTIYKLPWNKLNDDIELVATTAAEKLTDASELVVEPSSDNCVVTKVDKDTKGSDGWTISKNAQNLAITIETKGSHILTSDSFALFDSDKEQESGWSATPVGDVRFNLSAPELNKTKDGLVYTLSGSAAAYKGRKLTVTSIEQERELHVDLTNINGESLLVKQNGMIVEGKKDGDHMVYPKTGTIDPFATLVVTAYPLQGFKLTGKADLNGKSVSASKGVVSTSTALCDDDGFVTVSYGTEGILNMLVATAVDGESNPLWKFADNNEKFEDLDSTCTPVIGLAVGTHDLLITDKDVSVTPANAFDTGFVTVDSNSIVSVHPDKIKDTSKKTLFKVSVTGKDDGTGKKYKNSLSFSFRQSITAVTVSGKGVDKGTITQAIGTTESYDIKVNDSADINRLTAKVVDNDDSFGKNASAWIDPVKKKLYVSTFLVKEKDGEWESTTLCEDEKNIKIQFLEGDPESDFTGASIIDGATVVVKPEKTEFSAPNITVKNVSDRHFVVALSTPKGVEGYKHLYYKVYATLSEGETRKNDNMVKESSIQYIEVGDPEESGVWISVVNFASRETAPQKYDITAQLVQKELEKSSGDTGIKFYETGKSKTLTNQKTKESNLYESKLTLTKKTTAFTKGQTFVPVAVASFSKNTSYTFISKDPDKTYLADSEGNVIATLGEKTATNPGGLLLAPDGLSIYIEDTSNIPVGKAKLYVTPDLPGATQFTPATIDLTVKQPIDSITVTPSGDSVRLFKQDGKAATLKFTATLNGGGNKPASSSVKWEITSRNVSNEDYISINEKTGVLTVDKNLLLNPGSDVNWVTVQAIANDFAENAGTTSNVINVFITNKSIKLESALLIKEDGNTNYTKDEAIAGIDVLDLNKAKLAFWDASDPTNAMEDLSSLSLKVSPAKGLSVDPATGAITATKAGKYTVTATATDGGKSSIKCVINNLGMQFKQSGAAVLQAYDLEAGSYYDFNSEYLKDLDSHDLFGNSELSRVVFFDSKGTMINYDELTITAPKDLSLDTGTGKIRNITKEGKYKITAKPKDGSKATASLELNFEQTEEQYNFYQVKYADGKDDILYLDGYENMTANAANVDADIFEIVVTRDDSSFDYNTRNAKLSVKSGGKLVATVPSNINGEPQCIYAVKPTASTLVMEFTYKPGKDYDTEKVVCTVSNIQVNDKRKQLKLNNGSKSEFIGSTTIASDTTFVFDLPDGVALDGTCRLMFHKNDAFFKLKKEEEIAAYRKLLEMLNNAGKNATFEGNTVSTAASDYREILPGTYKIDVNLVKIKKEGDDVKGVEPVTKPVTVTFKVNAPKKASAKLASTKFTMEKDQTLLTLDTAKNSAFYKIDPNSVVLFDNNDKGVVSDFTKCFTYTPENIKDKSIVLGFENKHVWTEAEKKSKKATITGWVQYSVIPEDGNAANALTLCEKIVVTIPYVDPAP